MVTPAIVTVAALLAAACGDGGTVPEPPQPNRPPAAQGSIPAQTVPVGETVTVSVASAFSDPDGDALTYAATSSAPGVASVAVSGADVTVTGVSAGTATVTVTASDPGDLSAQLSFEVTVPNRAPAVTDSIPAQTVPAGDSVSLDLAERFSDPDGDALTYTAESSASGVATVGVSGASMTITGVAPGTATATVTASDPDGLSARLSFGVTVPNGAPEAVDSIPDLTLAAGGGARVVQPTALFEDPDHDDLDLTYAVALSDSVVASAEVLVDSEGHVIVIATGKAPGSSTLTITATDPEGLSAEQSTTLTVDNSGFTPLSTIRVDNNVISLADGLIVVVGECTFPIVNVPLLSGLLVTVDSAKWQMRRDSAAAWADVADTEANTGQLCPLSTQTPGEYRMVFGLTLVVDEHFAPLTGDYRSGNSFTVNDTGANQAPVVRDDAPRQGRVAASGGPIFFAPTVLFVDPDGDDLTFSVAVSDSAVVFAEVLVDPAGHSFLIVTGNAEGTATVTLRATDPGGLYADLVAEIMVDAGGYTPSPAVEVDNGVLRTLGLTLGFCTPPIINADTGLGLATVHSSKWQSRADASTEWTDVEGTEQTDGRLCPYSTDVVGDYRLTWDASTVLDEHVPAIRGNYASWNFFTVSSSG